MKQEDAEKLICPQLSGPVSYMRGDDAVTLIKTTTCIASACNLWDDFGDDKGDCGLRVLYEIDVSCNGGVK